MRFNMVLNRAHVAEFATVLANARKIAVLTGAGVSAESGIPTFRGEGGLWRTWNATELATPEAFRENPSLVWEFYHYRRCVVAKSLPNTSHYALAAFQQRCQQEGREFTLLTQNIDGLHMHAGSTDVVELHGSLWKTRCCNCNDVQENREMPICAALDGKGAPDTSIPDARIPTMQLPRCKLCNGLLRPHVVWFGESLDPRILRQVDSALQNCDLLLLAGTSAVVYPAAGYAPLVSALGGAVAEFNIDDTPASRSCRPEKDHCPVCLETNALLLYQYCLKTWSGALQIKFKFRGPSASTIPEALGIPLDQLPRVLTSSDEAQA